MESKSSRKILCSSATSALIVLTIFCTFTPGMAQDKTKSPSLVQLKDKRIPVVSLSPRDSASSIGPKIDPKIEKQAIDAPAPSAISWSERTEMLRRSGVSIVPARPPRAVRLSLRQQFVAGGGLLRLRGPYLTMPREDLVLFQRAPSDPFGDPLYKSVEAVFTLDRGRYLVEFHVSSHALQPATFFLQVGDRRLEFTSAGGAEHVPVVVESAGAGQVEFRLGGRPNFNFYSVEMMRLDER